jgi:mannose-6-phosphate isomerase-like protein (cupin superfamily)
MSMPMDYSVPPLGQGNPTPDATAPDGSEIRLLADARQGATKSSLVEVILGADKVYRPVRHRTVEEVWYVQEGAGKVWRCPPGAAPETVLSMDVVPGHSLVILAG